MKHEEIPEDGAHDLEIHTHETTRIFPSNNPSKDQFSYPNVISYDREPINKRRKVKFCVFAICLGLLVIGRFSVPSNIIEHVRDIPMEWLDSFNKFVEENYTWRITFQIICSLFMDIMFIGTGIFWIIRGNSSRLVVSTLAFYIVRAIIQALFWLPFPQGFYWWDDPGFPSAVVPYGRGSDFFFSGHIGFVTLCASEWKKNGYNKVAWGIVVGGVYTAFILLAYHVHYTIDLFTGIFFAHWMFRTVDDHKEKIDNCLISLYYSGRFLFQKGV